MVTLNTAIKAAQIQQSTISGGHLASYNQPTADYVLSWDSDNNKFKWIQTNSFVMNEIPDGNVDGSNTVFTLSNTPLEHSEQVYLNGLLQKSGSSEDYTISSGTITFNSAPEVGDIVLVSYLLEGSSGSASQVGYGYICGGQDGAGKISIIDRIQFPFDNGTASHVGNLSISADGLYGVNSSQYGYTFGNNSTTVERFQFPFDSGTSATCGNLIVARDSRNGGCNSSSFGHVGGGNTSGGYTSSIEKFQFPFDSGISSNIGNLSIARMDLVGCNSSSHGYFYGGYNGARISAIDRIQFPFNSGTASHVGNLSIERNELGGCNSSNYGFGCGGFVGSTLLTTIDRFQFPFDSGTASHVGNLSVCHRYGAAGLNSTNYGFIAASYDNYSDTFLSTIDRFQFPFDSGTSTAVGNLSGSRAYAPAGVDNTDFVSMFV